MAQWHLESGKKYSGGGKKKHRKKRKTDRGSEFLGSTVGKKKLKTKRAEGGNRKMRLASVQEASVVNPKTGESEKTKIISVEKNPANPHYARRDIITKGAIIKTEKGLARVSSRLGQDGVVNAVLEKE